MSLIKSFGFYDDLSATEDIALSMKIASHGSNRYKLMYAMDVVCYTESVQSISGLLKQRYRWKYGSLQSLFRFTKGFIVNKKYQSASMLFYRLPMAYFSELLLVLEPFLVTLAIYLSIISGTITLFFSAYMMLSIYLLIVLWSDELLTVRSKTTLSVFVPIIYFLFYIMSFIQIVAAFKSVAKLPELFKEQHSNTWISPVRSGRATVEL
jgi:cellulose synthase/poly-beta-1,6-N-acetylglucosamine synthase-like glycosyltransferase